MKVIKLIKWVKIYNVGGCVSLRIRVIDSDGRALQRLTLIYAILRRRIGYLEGPYLVVRAVSVSIDDIAFTEDDYIPEVTFCPSDEPEELDGEELREVCIEVYKYFSGKCAACAIKVYSIVAEEWLVSEGDLIKVFEVSKKYGLPLEFSYGNLILTTCPESYELARNLPPGSYVRGVEKLREAVNDLRRLGLKPNP